MSYLEKGGEWNCTRREGEGDKIGGENGMGKSKEGREKRPEDNGPMVMLMKIG